MEAYVAECEAQDEQLDAQMDAQMEEAHKTTAFFRQLVRDCTRGDGFHCWANGHVYVGSPSLLCMDPVSSIFRARLALLMTCLVA